MLERLPGYSIGPQDDPERYQFEELVSRTSLPNRPVEVWRARRGSDASPVDIKLVSADPDRTYPQQNEYIGSEAWSLWVVAGYSKQPRFTRDLTLPPPDLLSCHAGRGHCVAIVDSFFLPPWPDYTWDLNELEMDSIVVTERLGPTLAEWKEQQAARGPIPFFTMRRIIRQILVALDFLHHELYFSYNALDSGFSSASGYHEAYYTDLYSPEQALTFHGHTHGQAEKGDIWHLGLLLSFLIFDKNLASPDDLTPYTFLRSPANEALLGQWHVKLEGVVNFASLDPERGWPSFFDTASDLEPDFSGYSDFPFYLEGVTPGPSIRDRVLAEAASSSLSPSELELLISFLKACWTLNPYTRPSAQDLLRHDFVKGVEEW
ncbi:hypothetical protein JCM11251_003657 [Rhodosporidiobolus azoricus]